MATETTARAPEEARVETREADEFTALLKQSFKPRTERAATEVENAVNTLVEQALADTSLIKSDVLDTIEEMIAQLDKKLSAQMNAIIHASEFQQIEGAWRGLAYLIFQSETDAMLKIRVMNISKSELYRHLRHYRSLLRSSPKAHGLWLSAYGLSFIACRSFRQRANSASPKPPLPARSLPEVPAPVK